MKTLGFFLAILVSQQVFERYSNYQKIIKLHNEYAEWIDNFDASMPNWAIFRKLYEQCFNEPYIYEGRIADGFPSRKPDVALDQAILLTRMESYYRMRLLQLLEVSYWFNIITHWPQKLLSYLGVSPDSLLAKSSNVIYWCLSLFWSLFRSHIIRVIDHLFL